MKYTSEYIKSLSFLDYLELMARELNENGYKVTDGSDYKVYDYLPKNALMLNVLEDPNAMIFLKSQGLLENGRCPTCGAPMSTGQRYYWFDRRYPSRKLYLCYGCHESHFHGDGHSLDGCPSGAPSENSSGTGCLLSLLLLPVFLIKVML